MLLNVRTIGGMHLRIDGLEASDSIDLLREKIEAHGGIPLDQQRMIFAGKQIEAGRTLGFYNLSNECTIHLCLRLRSQSGHSATVDAGSLLPMSLFLQDQTGDPIVQVIDAVGSVPFTQVGPAVSLSRPAIGTIFVRMHDGSCERVTNHTPVLVTVKLPDEFEREFQYDYWHGVAADEVMRHLFAMVSPLVTDEMLEHGFNISLVRPSGDENLITSVDVLVSQENALRTLIVHAVAPGAEPAFRGSGCADDEGSHGDESESDSDQDAP